MQFQENQHAQSYPAKMELINVICLCHLIVIKHHWELSTSIQIRWQHHYTNYYYHKAVKWNLKHLTNSLFVGHTVSLVVQVWSLSCILPYPTPFYWLVSHGGVILSRGWLYQKWRSLDIPDICKPSLTNVVFKWCYHRYCIFSNN